MFLLRTLRDLGCDLVFVDFVRCMFSLLTPSDDAELEDVSAYVGVEDFDQSDVHVDGLQTHPCEGGQQEVMQQDGHGETQPVDVQTRQPAVQQEHHVEEQQRRAQVHQDLRGVVTSQFPEGWNDQEEVTCSDLIRTMRES